MVEDAISFWTDIQRYEDMLAADPHSYCFAPLSELYRKLGLLDDALHVAQKGCDLHPDYPGGFFALGNAYHAKGQNEQARQALEQVISLNPDHLQARKLLGQLYVESGDMARAKQMLEQVLQQNPDDLEINLLLESIASTAAALQPEEELLEEADVIEDLTEVLDETPPAETPAPSRVAEIPAQADKFGEYGGFEQSDEFWAIEAPEESPAPAQTQLQGARDPLTTATLAELYVSQGFIGKALAIYQELLSADRANQSYLSRCAELKELQERQQQAQPAAAPAPRPEAPAAQAAQAEAPAPQAPAAQAEVPAPQADVEAELSSWLENIRRRRDGV